MPKHFYSQMAHAAFMIPVLGDMSRHVERVFPCCIQLIRALHQSEWGFL